MSKRPRLTLVPDIEDEKPASPRRHNALSAQRATLSDGVKMVEVRIIKGWWHYRRIHPDGTIIWDRAGRAEDTRNDVKNAIERQMGEDPLLWSDCE